MSIRDFSTAPYLPLVSVRPAEMLALGNLPARDKDLLLPFIFLRPWATAHHLDSAMARVEEAYGRRPMVLDVAEQEPNGGVTRPVHEQLEELRSPIGGFRNWCDFIAANELVIPSLQILDVEQIYEQARFFVRLGRQIVVRLEPGAFRRARGIAEQIRRAEAPPTQICFIMDFRRQAGDMLLQLDQVLTQREALTEILPGSFLAISASSFPESFGITRQEIFERLFFNHVLTHTGPQGMIYSDRGSARAEPMGGGGVPTPRVDLAGRNIWAFFREGQEIPGDPESRAEAYQVAATTAMASEYWDPRLRLWGTQMVERTQVGDPNAISSPMKSTATRINIHLHQQLFYGSEPDQLYDTDEDWSD